MILMAPPDSDWDDIAALTGDARGARATCGATSQRLEECRYRPVWRASARLGIDPTGHGWDGWLPTEYAMPLQALGDDELVQLVRGSARAFVRGSPTPRASPAATGCAATATRTTARGCGGSSMGLCFTPLSTPIGTSGSARASVCSTSPPCIRIG